MQDENNHRQDKLTLRMTTLIFILCFLVPVIYSLVTGKCLFNTCSLKLECLKGFITEKNRDSFCSPSSMQQTNVKTSSGNLSSCPLKTPLASSSKPEELNKGESKPSPAVESQQKNFNISG